MNADRISSCFITSEQSVLTISDAFCAKSTIVGIVALFAMGAVVAVIKNFTPPFNNNMEQRMQCNLHSGSCLHQVSTEVDTLKGKEPLQLQQLQQEQELLQKQLQQERQERKLLQQQVQERQQRNERLQQLLLEKELAWPLAAQQMRQKIDQEQKQREDEQS